MQQIADLHIHSKYSRACSPELTLVKIDQTCRIKGVDIVASGDFTYPDWFLNLKNELEEISVKRENGFSPAGLYKLKSAPDDKIKFILSTELALIYKDGDRVRRIHLVVQAPSLEAVAELNNYLDKHYNIRSDGRPILGLSAPELIKLCLKIHPRFLIYPAHIWTPWFSLFGSKSGFDTLEECFKDYHKDIYAYETGLSSDPAMNWRLSALDSLTLLSNSDAHSLPNIGREANVFQLAEVSYDTLYQVIKDKPRLISAEDTRKKNKNYLDYTIEFYPEEGMYHYDGHRDCRVRFSPEQTKRHQGVCPVCKKPLTIGVMSRVEELADRPAGFQPEQAPGYKKVVELDKIIAEALSVKSRASKRVQFVYNQLVKQGGGELNALLNLDLATLRQITSGDIALGIGRMRQEKLIIEPGFDGQYGTVKIFNSQDRNRSKQEQLF